MGNTQNVVDRAHKAVSEATTVQASASVLIAAIIAAARDNAGDVTALNAAMDAFEGATAKLSQDVIDNTPSAPPSASTRTRP